jgi:hypothetical protein
VLTEEKRLRELENRPLRRILGPWRGEIIGGWRKLHSKELRNLVSLPNIVRINSRMMGWARNVASIERRGMHIRFWWESQKGTDH